MVQEFTPAESEDRLYDIGVRLPAPRQSAGPAGQPAIADDAGPAQAAGFVDLRHRRGARHVDRPSEAKIARQAQRQTLEEELDEDYEAFDETARRMGRRPAERSTAFCRTTSRH